MNHQSIDANASKIPHDLITVAEVADLLRTKEKTIRQWVYLRKIPSIKINGLVRFSRKQIHAWVDAQARGGHC